MEEEPGCCHQWRSQRSGPITDILVWIECYASMVSVLATRYSSKKPQLMTYLKTIVKAHRTYTGEGWVTYDVCFRRKAAITKSLDWGKIDFTVYNETLPGRAKLISYCQRCSSDMHKSQECANAPTTPKTQVKQYPIPAMTAVQLMEEQPVLFQPVQVCARFFGVSSPSPSVRSRLSPVRTYLSKHISRGNKH